LFVEDDSAMTACELIAICCGRSRAERVVVVRLLEFAVLAHNVVDGRVDAAGEALRRSRLDMLGARTPKDSSR